MMFPWKFSFHPCSIEYGVAEHILPCHALLNLAWGGKTPAKAINVGAVNDVCNDLYVLLRLEIEPSTWKQSMCLDKYKFKQWHINENDGSTIGTANLLWRWLRSQMASAKGHVSSGSNRFLGFNVDFWKTHTKQSKIDPSIHPQFQAPFSRFRGDTKVMQVALPEFSKFGCKVKGCHGSHFHPTNLKSFPYTIW